MLPFPRGGMPTPFLKIKVVPGFVCFTHPFRLQSVTVMMFCEKAFVAMNNTIEKIFFLSLKISLIKIVLVNYSFCVFETH